MSRIQDVINTLKSYGFKVNKEEYHKDIDEAVVLLQEYRDNILDNKSTRSSEIAPSPTYPRPPITNSCIPTEKEKRIVITDTNFITCGTVSSDRFLEKITKNIEEYQDKGLEVEVQHQMSGSLLSALIIARKEV